MNFREWLINEKQSAQGNRNRAPGRLLNVGPTRDYTQDFKAPARTPYWAQIVTSYVSSLGGQMDKALYGKSGIGRPKTPTQFLEPSLWTPDQKKAVKENWKSVQYFEFDATDEWFGIKTAEGDTPLKDIDKNSDEMEQALGMMRDEALKSNSKLRELYTVGIDDGKGGKLMADKSKLQTSLQLRRTNPVFIIKNFPMISAVDPRTSVTGEKR